MKNKIANLADRIPVARQRDCDADVPVLKREADQLVSNLDGLMEERNQHCGRLSKWLIRALTRTLNAFIRVFPYNRLANIRV
jgi:hypothetical protein